MTPLVVPDDDKERMSLYALVRAVLNRANAYDIGSISFLIPKHLAIWARGVVAPKMTLCDSKSYPDDMRIINRCC